jgi:hypothetical protein
MSPSEAGIRFLPPPVGILTDRIFDLLVGEHLRECAVFLGQKNEDGVFIPEGTGFVIYKVAFERAHTYLVTAKHILGDIPGDHVLVRSNGSLKSGIKYLSLDKKKWHFHPEHREVAPKKKYIDVAVYEVDFDWADLEIVPISDNDIVTDEIIIEYNIGIGDEVVIPSLFLSHIGRERNVPIIRVGNIAAMPEEPVPSSRGMMDGYLVESRSIGGVSGSPVLMNMAVRPDSVNRKELKKSERPHFLLGLVHGYYTMVDQHEWVSRTDQQVGDINTGISIVVPIQRIMETIDPLYRKSIEVTEKLDKAEMRKSGARTPISGARTSR